MKILKYLLMINFVAFTMVQADQFAMQKYENEITDIAEIAGAKSYTLVLSCSQLNPIVVYAPDNFAESGQDDVHRYVLPNTTIHDDVQNDSASVQQDGQHVEVLLFGQLLLQKTGNHTAKFMVSKN